MIKCLENLGFTYDQAHKLRRISMALNRWFEMECGTSNDAGTNFLIERDETTGKPFKRIQYNSGGKWIDRKYPVADREKGARKRLDEIMKSFPTLTTYIQGDCRGASLHILRKGIDIKQGEDIDSVYNRGVAVY